MDDPKNRRKLHGPWIKFSGPSHWWSCEYADFQRTTWLTDLQLIGEEPVIVCYCVGDAFVMDNTTHSPHETYGGLNPSLRWQYFIASSTYNIPMNIVIGWSKRIDENWMAMNYVFWSITLMVISVLRLPMDNLAAGCTVNRRRTCDSYVIVWAMLLWCTLLLIVPMGQSQTSVCYLNIIENKVHKFMTTMNPTDYCI